MYLLTTISLNSTLVTDHKNKKYLLLEKRDTSGVNKYVTVSVYIYI